MTLAEARKAVASACVGVAAIAGGLVSQGLITGEGAAWVLFAVIVVQAIAHVVATYATPNGATLTERVKNIEAQYGPDLHNILAGLSHTPVPDKVKAEAAKFDLLVQSTYGVAEKAPWPTNGVSNG